MINERLRLESKQKRVPLWQIGERLGVSEITMCRKMRHQLPDDETETMLGIIDQIAAEREEERNAD